MSVKLWFGSDQHFFHKRIMEICPETRQGDTLEEMHELMIQQHNKQVKPYDIVWFLGDFSFQSWKKTIEILKRLNGRINLVRGNHDHWLHTESRKYIDELHDYHVLKHNGRYIVMCHYPIARWDRMGYGAFHLHGHSHGEYKVDGRVLDVGIDARPQKDMGLWEFDEIVAHMEPLEYKGHHKNRTEL